jgi:beta-galactosidase
MATVTYDGQSFLLDGRRVWIVGASIEYARVEPDSWADRIAAARQAGFTAVATSCPWFLHEPRKGRYSFTGPTDLRRFVRLCGEAGVWVILRPGPYVGGGYDGGGLPSWLLETAGVRPREASEDFLERVGQYLRRLLAEVVDLQVTSGGPILLLQSEHAWLCSNQSQADRYLQEVTRYLKENGIAVPIINTNDLWQESPGTIDTWRGAEDLLVHLRQLRTVQPDAPRLVSEFRAAVTDIWGDAPVSAPSPAVLVQWFAQVLAAAAQGIVMPFHGGSSFGFLGGRVQGRPDGFVTTAAGAGAPLGEAGERGPAYRQLKRLVSFARAFGHVFAELDPDYHPVSLDVEAPAPEGGTRRGAPRGARRVSVVPLKGAAGQVVFVFAQQPHQQATLLLEQGIRMPVHLGDQTVAWYVLGVDLRGAGRLDYANLCPYAIVDRGLLVLQGPAKAQALLSVDGAPLVATVPAGARPLVVQHKRVTVVFCNQEQIDATYQDDGTLYVGAAGLTASGVPVAVSRGRPVWAIRPQGELREVEADRGWARPAAAAAHGGAAAKMGAWEAASTAPHTSGESPRFATLEGPATLAACGALLGYGWYRIRFEVDATRRRRLHMPEVADRAHLFVDGEFQRVVGVGRGADRGPFEIQLRKGPRTLVCLVDNMGRFSEGNDLGERKGLYGHIQQVRALTGVKAQKGEGEGVDPFTLRGYIAGRARGQRSDSLHAIWTFEHARTSQVLLDVDGAGGSGTFLLNERPFAYYAGSTGACLSRHLLSRVRSFRRGRNVLRFAPDARQPQAVEEMLRAVALYECVETLTASAAWAFAKWEPPPSSAFAPVGRGAAADPAGPRWWRCAFELREPAGALWVDTAGLSKGQVFVNGHNLGRYFTSTADGKPVGPQTRLYLPGSWVHSAGPSEVLVFDEHGFSPQRVKVLSRQ